MDKRTFLRSTASMALLGVPGIGRAQDDKWGKSLGYPSGRTAVAAALAALVYGVTDEWHQTMVPSRTGRPEDLVWDLVGATIAVGLIALVGRTRANPRGPSTDDT